MDRKKEIYNDVWEIMRRIYNISTEAAQSDKQIQFLNEVTAYVEDKSSKQDERKKKCLKK